jgi:hypothetical protein
MPGTKRENKCFLQAALSPPGRAAFCLPQNACCLQIKTANFLRFAVCFEFFEKQAENFAKPLDRSSSA